MKEKQFIFKKLHMDSIEPKGWIKEQLQRQFEGLTGNIDVAGYPFNTTMWAGKEIPGKSSNEFDITWWPYEQTAYYLDGTYRVSKYLNNNKLYKKVMNNVDYVIKHLDETGRYSTPLAGEWWRWPYASFNKILQLEYNNTNDPKYLQALVNHYKTFCASDFADDLEVTNVEILCWIYSKTSDISFLNMAEEAYDLFKSDYSNRDRAGSDLDFSSDRVPDQHGVVYIEILKIPVILYMYTGNKKYLEEAEKGLLKMEKHFMLVSGLPSTTEHFREVSEISAHETCNTATLPYTYGKFVEATGNVKYSDSIEKSIFNAAFGSITKDFKSHQYFSAPNQVISVEDGQNFGYHKGMSAYLPGHHVECCTGNVNRFMPYYTELMWLEDKQKNPVLNLYGPSKATFKLKDKSRLEIIEETNYPFQESVRLRVGLKENKKFKMYLRIPSWSKNTTIHYNNQYFAKAIAGTFFEIDQEWSNKDTIEIFFDMKPEIVEVPYGISFSKGPIVYSLSIDSNTERLKEYDKQSDNFPAFNRYPLSKWNYVVSRTLIKKYGIETIKTDNSGFPFEIENVNQKLRIPVYLGINFEEVSKHSNDKSSLLTPRFPRKIVHSKEHTFIELVPYGSTILRMTVFPKT